MYSPKTKARAVVIVFFLLGMLMGIGVMNFIAAKSATANKKPTWLETINAEVGLSQEQKGTVSAVLEAHNQRSKEISNQIKPQLEELKLNTRAKIRLNLNTDQQAKFDLLLKRKDAEKAAAEAAQATPSAGKTK